MEREVGGGIGMGNICRPMAVSFQCMTKFTTNKKKVTYKKKIKKKNKKQRHHLLTKVHVFKAMVFPIVMYRCESWTIKKAVSKN